MALAFPCCSLQCAAVPVCLVRAALGVARCCGVRPLLVSLGATVYVFVSVPSGTSCPSLPLCLLRCPLSFRLRSRASEHSGTSVCSSSALVAGEQHAWATAWCGAVGHGACPSLFDLLCSTASAGGRLSTTPCAALLLSCPLSLARGTRKSRKLLDTRTGQARHSMIKCCHAHSLSTAPVLLQRSPRVARSRLLRQRHGLQLVRRVRHVHVQVSGAPDLA